MVYRCHPAYALPAQAAGEREPRFVLSGEISTIYKKNGKTRKVHHVILLPGLDASAAVRLAGDAQARLGALDTGAAGYGFRLAASFGVAEARRGGGGGSCAAT